MIAPQFNIQIFKRQDLVFLALAVLLHLVVLHGINLESMPAKVKMQEKPIAVQFKNLPDLTEPKEESSSPQPGPVAAPASKKTLPAKKAKTSEEPPLPGPMPEPLENSVVDLTDATPPIIVDNKVETSPENRVTTKTESAAETKANQVTAPTTKDTVSSEGPQTYPVRPPQTGKISMRIVRTEMNRNPVYGDGEINWEFRSGRYKMRIEASLDLLLTSINLYQLNSEGNIDVYGITPTMSTEKRRSRSETATHFDQANKSVSFSSSNKTVEVQNGVQDKASFIMQLAGIAYAEPEKFQPGREIRLQVAEERDVSTFVFVVTAFEEVETKMGKIMAWHVIRPPLPGSYNSKLEVWLAPEQHWYPIQIRNTESNGAVTTQTATNIVSIPNTER